MKNNKVVLAYSGGLDTSFCIAYLTREKGLEVHALTVNTGSFRPEEVAELEARALELGAASFHCAEATETYYDQCLRYLLFGNVLRNQTYPLSVSAERSFQALETVRYARCIGADAVAHGSTGAGNDQVRFDVAFHVLGAELDILTPIRDLRLSREAEIDYLEKQGFRWNRSRARYSVNQGLWGTTVGGAETLSSHQPLPEEAWPTPVEKRSPRDLTLHFERGEPRALDGKPFPHPVDLIRELEALAAPYGIGRDVHVGDTVIGIKGRVGFQAAAPLLLIKAHHLLEKHVLSKWQQYWKQQLAEWYGLQLHEGLWLEPTLRDIEGFLESTQEKVSGEVFVRLHPHRFELLGIRSPHDLMNARFGQYGEMNEGWSGEDVRGFAKILANPLRIYQHTAEAVENEKP